MKQFLLALSIAGAAINANAQNKSIAGSWEGYLEMPNGKLKMIMHIAQADSNLSVKLDVPQQMAKSLAANKASLKHDSLVVTYSMMAARYIGTYKGDSIVGLWDQRGFKLPLTLYPAKGSVAEIKRPQDPVKPYPYYEEQVTFKNEKAGITLAGTFTWPKYRPNCPAVVLISGSGPQNRDEELLGHRPFLVLADELSKKGIAVLRFDDRGVSQSEGDFSTATTFDFSTDAEAAFNYLKTRTEIDKKKIGLAGHSEGGMIAPMVASRVKDVAFIVLMAGPGVKGSDLLLMQSAALSEAAGLSPQEVNDRKAINKKIYDWVLSNGPHADDSIARTLKNLGMNDVAITAQLHSMESPWFKYMLQFEPAAYLSKTKCPVLAINGKKDLQVPYKENLDGIEKALKQAHNKTYTVKAYDGLNHLFQHCNTGMPGEYGTIEETLSPEVMSDMSAWILKTAAAK